MMGFKIFMQMPEEKNSEATSSKRQREQVVQHSHLNKTGMFWYLFLLLKSVICKDGDVDDQPLYTWIGNVYATLGDRIRQSRQKVFVSLFSLTFLFIGMNIYIYVLSICRDNL